MVRHAVWFGLAVTLAACQTPARLAPEAAEDFGNAVRHNIAAQRVNPEPAAVPADPAMDGSRAALAVSRYKADEIKRPAVYGTSGVAAKAGK